MFTFMHLSALEVRSSVMILCNCDCQFDFSIVFFQYYRDSEVFKLQDFKKIVSKG